MRDGSNAKEAASALRKLTEDPAERAVFAETAKRIAKVQFSRETVIETLSVLYLKYLTDAATDRPTGISQRSTTSNWRVTNP